MVSFSIDSSLDFLLENKLIDGETYLFCFDNGISDFKTIFELYIQDNSLQSFSGFNDNILNNLEGLCLINVREGLEQLEFQKKDEKKCNTQQPKEYEIKVDIEYIYKILKNELSTRTKNILEDMEKDLSYPNKPFFDFLLKSAVNRKNSFYTNKRNIYYKFRNASNKTVSEIIEMGEKLKLQFNALKIQTYEKQNTSDKDTQISDDWEINVDIAILYNKLKKEYSTRTQNILEDFEQKLYYPNRLYFDYFVHYNLSPLYSFKNIRNAGRKSISELIELAEKLSLNFNSLESTKDVSNESVPFNVKHLPTEDDQANSFYDILSELNTKKCDNFKSDFIARKGALSTRANNQLTELLSLNENSIIDFFVDLTNPSFKWKTYRNIGVKTSKELDEFSGFIKDLIINISKDINGDKDGYFKIKTIQNHFNICEEYAREINDCQNQLKYFPLFLLIDKVFKSNEKDWEIIKHLTSFYNHQKIETCSNIGLQLNITRERVRQIRNQIIDKIIRKINFIIKHDFIDSSKYYEYTIMKLDDKHIERLNNSENVDFSLNFLNMVLSLLFSTSHILIGDPQKVFISNENKNNENLYIIPREYSLIFDFDKFRADIGRRLNEKVYEVYKVNIESLILMYFPNDIYIDKLNEIIGICKMIIFRDFGILPEIDGTIIINCNAKKNLPDLIEDVIRKQMRQMTLDEIYTEVKEIMLGQGISREALRTGILRNCNILPVGRDSTYVLKEWASIGIKGGTIRELVAKLLQPLETPLSIDKISEYVKRYRSETNAKSIYYNLKLDNSKQFSFYKIRNRSYIGLSAKRYTSKYLNIDEPNLIDLRNFEESYSVFEKFIIKENRFPFSSSNNKEEVRLHRFFYLLKKKRDKGLLLGTQLERLDYIESKYKKLVDSKKDYEWNQNFKDVRKFITINGVFPTHNNESFMYFWLQRQADLIKDKKLNRVQIEMLQSLYTIEKDA